MKNVRIYLWALVSLLHLELFAQGEKPFQYRNIGPSRGGRVTAVEGVASAPNVFYMGATGGGLWKSTDYGIHWDNISDGYFATPSIGAIAIDQNNPEVIYVGTGSDAIRSNVIVGRGMYKSIDAGKTWKHIGLNGAGQIGAVEIHPQNNKLVYVAAVGQPFRKSEARGVYRTKDGGETWDKILYLSDSVGAVDLEFSPDNPNIIYAAMWRAERKPWTIISGDQTSGVFKSIDGGDTWRKIKNGLPEGLIGKIDFAVSKAKPNRVWAQVQAPYGQEGLYRSDDYAESWTKVEMPEHVHKSIMYRPFYFTNLDVNPQNADNLWAGTKQVWTSYDGGKSWKEIVPPHADHHDLWINPIDTAVMIAGNDGGAGISRDGGANWTHEFNQPTAELYTADVDDRYPYYLYSGQQDNSTIAVPSRKPYLDVLGSNDNHGLNDMMYWENVGGCETGPVIPKPGDPNIVYSNCKGQFTVFNRTTGREQAYYIGAESLYGNHPLDITYRFQRVTPMEVSPHDPNTVYYGSQFLHKTSNGGKNWETISPDLTANLKEGQIRSGGPIDEDISGEEYYSVLYAIQESPVQEGVIWTGSNDGLVHVTRDGGKTWTDVTPKVVPAGGRVSNIDASPHKTGRAYVAIYRDYLGDEKPYFYKTNDFGSTWISLSDGFPHDHVARVVRESPDKEGLLFAGTEFGIFVSFDDGENWSSFQKNLPTVPVADISFVRNDLAIATLGRSFWILDDISALTQWEIGEEKRFKLFKPRDFSDGLSRIYFRLPSQITDSLVSFEFWRGDQLIHAKKESLKELPADELGVRMTRWDMRYYLKNGKKDFQGPALAPGQYSVKITYGGNTDMQTFNYQLNPELSQFGVSVADLVEQEKLAYATATLLMEVRKSIRELEAVITFEKNKKKKQKLMDRLSALKKGPHRYDKPMLQEHVDYLLDMLTISPQRPGADAYVRLEQLKRMYADFKNN